MSVYRMIDIVGTSPDSWEDAAKQALATARHSLRDLRIAEVTEFDIALNDVGEVYQYRTKLRVSFKYEGKTWHHSDQTEDQPQGRA